MTTTPLAQHRRLALHWFTLAGLVAAFVFGGYALSAWHAPVWSSGGYCGRAITFHPGAGRVSGGELTDADREALTAQCRAAGAAARNTGRGGAAGAVLGAVIAGAAMTLQRRDSARSVRSDQRPTAA